MLRFDKKVCACLALWLVLFLAWAACMAEFAKADGWQVGRAQAIARKVWHNPCNGSVRIAWDNTDLATAAYVLEGDTTCTVHMRTSYRYGWQAFCATMIHEYGHLAGYRDHANTADPYHSLNPDSVMYAQGVTYDPRCENRGHYFLTTGAR